MYIYEQPGWPKFTWVTDDLVELLSRVRYSQGRLLGRMESLGFNLKQRTNLQVFTQDVLTTSEIEGESLDPQQVRSSLAKRLGIDIARLKAADRKVDGVVEMLLDATQNHKDELNTERLFRWHAGLFPAGRSGVFSINRGAWRDDSAGPMQVVSGIVGHERVHFRAPPAESLTHEMNEFLKWFEAESNMDAVLKSGVAHFWFVTIHPFDDGNGRIARAIADMVMARSEQLNERFYSMSAQIRKERDAYYDILEFTQKRSMDITPWMKWYLNCMARAIDEAHSVQELVLRKARFWESISNIQINERQNKILNLLLDGFEGKLNSSKWATLTKCSQDSANRDIFHLVQQGILIKEPAGGRSTSYSLSEKYTRT